MVTHQTVDFFPALMMPYGNACAYGARSRGRAGIVQTANRARRCGNIWLDQQPLDPRLGRRETENAVSQGTLNVYVVG